MTDNRDFDLIFKEEVTGKGIIFFFCKGIINAQQQENQLNKTLWANNSFLKLLNGH